MATTPYVSVDDFAFPTGWAKPAHIETRARWYCQQLEDGQILFFSMPPFDLPNEDRQFLLGQHPSRSRLHKNVSYRPAQDVLRGFTPEEPLRGRMHQVMRNYSTQVIQFLTRFLIPYAGRWSLDYASFRPFEEEGRQLPFHKRNDLLHVDAFPSRPTWGSRILRVFTNLHTTKPRVWLTTDRFGELARRFALAAGLRRIAKEDSFWGRQRNRLGRVLGLPGAQRSRYDRFMLRFHNHLKEDARFQASCAKTRVEFPPLGTWLVFSDGVPHAVLSGQFALEQTVLVPPTALVAPETSPLCLLEVLCLRPLAR